LISSLFRTKIYGKIQKNTIKRGKHPRKDILEDKELGTSTAGGWDRRSVEVHKIFMIKMKKIRGKP
jgi:hypothetical protein